MKKSTQSKIAGWTSTVGVASAIIPIVALLTVFGAGVLNLFWIKCIGICAYAFLTFWILGKIEKGTFEYIRLGWVISITYFATILFTIFILFEELSMIFLLGFAEVGGVILSLVGLLHSVVQGQAEPVAGGDATR